PLKSDSGNIKVLATAIAGGFRLHHLLAAVVAAGAANDVRMLRFAAVLAHGHAGGSQGVVGPAHVALGFGGSKLGSWHGLPRMKTIAGCSRTYPNIDVARIRQINTSGRGGRLI